jgi:hypothetical protein
MKRKKGENEKYYKSLSKKDSKQNFIMHDSFYYIGLYFSAIKTNNSVVKIKNTNIVNYKLATSQSTFSLLLT